MHWRKSKKCASSACVEVAQGIGVTLVRDNKDLSIAPLTFHNADWMNFIQQLKNGK